MRLAKRLDYLLDEKGLTFEGLSKYMGVPVEALRVLVEERDGQQLVSSQMIDIMNYMNLDKWETNYLFTA